MNEAVTFGPKQGQPDLPIFSIAYRSVLLPFANFKEFLRFGWIPYSAMVAMALLGWVLAYYRVRQNEQQVISVIANTLVFTPFAIAWFRLTLLGPRAVARRPVFAVGTVELKYLAAYSVLILALGVTVGLPVILVQAAHLHYYITHEALPLTVAAVVFIVGASVMVIICIRCSFVFAAIAIQRYAGFQTALQQTRGYFERMLAIEAIALAPWVILRTLITHAQRSSAQLMIALLDFGDAATHTIMVATTIATVALSYKFLILDRHEHEAALSRAHSLPDRRGPRTPRPASDRLSARANQRLIC